MNAELHSQHEAAKARKARINAGPPVCRAIASPTVRERPRLPRGEVRRRPPPLAAAEAIEREHMVRIRCIREAYEAERERRRAIFAAEMKEVSERELADIGASAAYRAELLSEVRS